MKEIDQIVVILDKIADALVTVAKLLVDHEKRIKKLEGKE